MRVSDEITPCPESGSEGGTELPIGGAVPGRPSRLAKWALGLGIAGATDLVISTLLFHEPSFGMSSAIAVAGIVLGLSTPSAIVLGVLVLTKGNGVSGTDKRLAMWGIGLSLLASPMMLFIHAPLALVAYLVWVWLRARKAATDHHAQDGMQPGTEPALRLPRSNLALASVVLAGLGIVTFGMTLPFAVLFGLAAMVQLARSRGQMRGWGLAAAGTLIPMALLGVMAYPAFLKAAVSAHKTQCLSNVKNIAEALSMYASDYGAFPQASQWQSKAIDGYVRSEKVFVCPVAPKLRSGYAYNAALGDLSPDLLGDPANVPSIFESDRGWNAAGGEDLIPVKPRHMKGDNLGFADGHAKWFMRVRRDPEDRESWLKRYSGDKEGYLVWKPQAVSAPSGSGTTRD